MGLVNTNTALQNSENIDIDIINKIIHKLNTLILTTFYISHI